MLSVNIAGQSIFFFNDTATTEIYTLSLHDALPISGRSTGILSGWPPRATRPPWLSRCGLPWRVSSTRSEEHTSELQSQSNLVCRLLLEKKKLIPNLDPVPETRLCTLERVPTPFDSF